MSSTDNEAPALAPPDGLSSDFGHPDSLQRWSNLCISVCLSMSTIVFLLRTYVRVAIKRQWMLEDWMVCISWASLVTLCDMITILMKKHGGVHAWNMTHAEAHEAVYWFNVTSIEYGPAILFTKISILLLYRRVFLPQRGSYFDWVIRIFTTILIMFYVATTAVKIWECSPRARIWNKSIPGHCVSIPSLLNTSGLFNTITDILILLVPVKAVWNLHMTNRRKWGVVAVFTVGFMAPVFSMVGFIVRIKISASPDVTWNGPSILLWGAAEVTSGFICVCVPALAPLAHRRRPLRPSDSIIKGHSNSRRVDLSGNKESDSLEELQPRSEGDFELRANNPYTAALHPPAIAVVTSIRGGVRGDARPNNNDRRLTIGSADTGEQISASSRGAGIFTTVKMEHSYV